jgi:hypothetical protein
VRGQLFRAGPWARGCVAAGSVLLGALGFGCGDSKESWPGDRPRIDEVRFLGQGPQDPLGLQFELVFLDDGGDDGPDLAGGELRLFLAEQLAATLALQDIFARQAPPLSPSTTEGSFEILVRLQEGAVDPGEQLKIGFLLRDADGEESNQPTLTVRARAPGGGS